jgi:hypothetical protein
VSLAWVFFAGGLLELLGLFLVAWDVWEDHRAPEQQTPQQVRGSLGGKMWNKYTQAVATARMAGGNIHRRAWGVGLFALGVVVQTVGNIAAL